MICKHHLSLFIGIVIFMAGQFVFASQVYEKSRIIVLTDIENEPDDAESLVRFLTYANQFDVEGIIATTSVWLRDKTAEWRIYEILEAYKEVQPNLALHEAGYPTYDDLKEKVYYVDNIPFFLHNYKSEPLQMPSITDMECKLTANLGTYAYL